MPGDLAGPVWFTPGVIKAHGLCSQVPTSEGSACVPVHLEAGEEAEPAAVLGRCPAACLAVWLAMSGPTGAGGE